MYIYRHWHQFGPLCLVLIGFYVGHNYTPTYDVVVTQLAFWFFGIVFYAAMMINWSMYQAYFTGMPAGTKPAAMPERSVPLNIGTQSKTIALNQATTTPVLDGERKFAKTLIDMRRGNLDIDLTEDYWIAGHRYGDSREVFVNMLDRWKYNKLIDRAGPQKNATYVVIDWRAVRLVADGNHLPPPPDTWH